MNGYFSPPSEDVLDIHKDEPEENKLLLLAVYIAVVLSAFAFLAVFARYVWLARYA